MSWLVYYTPFNELRVEREEIFLPELVEILKKVGFFSLFR